MGQARSPPAKSEVQAVVRVEAAEGLLARLQQIERVVGGDPEVLRLVGRDADHRRLEDPGAGAVEAVVRAPRAGPAELRAAAAQHAAQRLAAGEERRSG